MDFTVTAEVQKVGPKAKKHLGDRAPQARDPNDDEFCFSLLFVVSRVWERFSRFGREFS